MEEKRRFRRTDFGIRCVLRKGESGLQLRVVNVSLKGVLAEAPAPSTLALGTDGSLIIRLDPSAEEIHAEVVLVHREESLLGFRIVSIDMDSMIHLRRLVEMNTGTDLADEDLAFLRKEA